MMLHLDRLILLFLFVFVTVPQVCTAETMCQKIKKNKIHDFKFQTMFVIKDNMYMYIIESNSLYAVPVSPNENNLLERVALPRQSVGITWRLINYFAPNEFLGKNPIIRYISQSHHNNCENKRSKTLSYLLDNGTLALASYNTDNYTFIDAVDHRLIMDLKFVGYYFFHEPSTNRVMVMDTWALFKAKQSFINMAKLKSGVPMCEEYEAYKEQVSNKSNSNGFYLQQSTTDPAVIRFVHSKSTENDGQSDGFKDMFNQSLPAGFVYKHKIYLLSDDRVHAFDFIDLYPAWKKGKNVKHRQYPVKSWSEFFLCNLPNPFDPDPKNTLNNVDLDFKDDVSIKNEPGEAQFTPSVPSFKRSSSTVLIVLLVLFLLIAIGGLVYVVLLNNNKIAGIQKWGKPSTGTANKSRSPSPKGKRTPSISSTKTAKQNSSTLRSASSGSPGTVGTVTKLPVPPPPPK